MSFRSSTIALSLMAGSVCLAPLARAGSGLPVAGDMLGEVRATSGAAQMGASVFLYDHYDRLVRQALTTETGRFAFSGLAPDVYSIRVVLASFETALRRNIAVSAGSPSILRVNLSSILSTVELVPTPASQGSLMSDDWKWILRASQATRPVLRLLPVSSSSQSNAPKFTETSGVLRLSAGEGDTAAGTTAQDMGTAFALATVVNGASRVRLSGKFGYLSNSGLPTAAFRATYSHDEYGEPGPKLSLTAHQVYFPGLSGSADPGSAYLGGGQTGPVLRTISTGVLDKLAVNDPLTLEYGGHLESISFLTRINRMSPFARATYDLGPAGELRFAFSSGATPLELLTGDGFGASPDLNQDLSALSVLPRISSEDDALRLEGTRTWEAGYKYVHGSHKFVASVYSEAVTDAAFMLSATSPFLSRSDLLPDLDSGNYVFDAGNYDRIGYDAAFTQAIGNLIELTVAAGRAGALTAPTAAPVDTAADARAQLRKAQRTWAAAQAAVTIPGSGTRIMTSYGWTDSRALMPIHYSLTEDTDQEEGWNIEIRQPLPRLNHMPGRFEATAEVRNALAQGYLPLNAGGHRAILTNSPRTLRGGLAFLF